jgi:predicted metal-dependent phosphoesterase TrpH
MRIDLHTHSAASDGTDAPGEIAAAARAAGLDVIALTDHDTTAGLAAAIAAAPPGLTVLPGIELSCTWSAGEASPSGISLHLLGYLIDPDAPELAATNARLRESRVDRGRLIAERLAAGGLPVRWERVRELAGGGSVGRPHLARALVEAGVVDSVDAAFRRYLHDSSPYYVGKAELDAVEAVRLVRRIGGVPVFAHPLARRRGRVVDDAAIAELAAAGLAGIEVDHPDHVPADRAHLRGLAAELGLLVTGSSDYHGRNKVVPLGAETTDPAAYEAILAAARPAQPAPAAEI